ncbi:rRNA-processing protein utp23 [Staphylotrichum tortipilum]|uniref:U three protein 23 n=1 Tax=Staphylotrichum tortipilum TaxID=2831512 RepID=A0AAN6RW65_9PEZI|nr:rRNA-processing protein utp23 [Staphylotrichum longicolle]
MGKRTKQYKKLMRSFELLGFRQPYQLLITSDVVLDTLKLDLVGLFEKTLSSKGLKPMITQCCIRALYAKNMGPNRDPAVAGAIERAKTFERRRCGHLMDADPLAERDCMLSVVDPKGKGENKFRYVVVTQDEELRNRLRSVVPTPLMYVRRSVMILEPMSSHSAQAREREERAKFMDGIIRRPQKRKREENDSEEEHSGSEDEGEGEEERPDQSKGPKAGDDQLKKKKKKQYGPKGANPLAVKKTKKQTEAEQRPRKPAAVSGEGSAETKAKRKRRKKASGAGAEGGGGGETESIPAAGGAGEAVTAEE